MEPTASPEEVSKPAYNVGRWTNAEHEAFIKSYRDYGRDWRKISQHVPTRSSIQIRTHAQKWFKKVSELQTLEMLRNGQRPPPGTTSSNRSTSHSSTRKPKSKSSARSGSASRNKQQVRRSSAVTSRSLKTQRLHKTQSSPNVLMHNKNGIPKSKRPVQCIGGPLPEGLPFNRDFTRELSSVIPAQSIKPELNTVASIGQHHESNFYAANSKNPNGLKRRSSASDSTYCTSFENDSSATMYGRRAEPFYMPDYIREDLARLYLDSDIDILHAV